MNLQHEKVRKYDGTELTESDRHVIVNGTRTSCINQQNRTVELAFETFVREEDGILLLNLCNGVTNHETWRVEGKFVAQIMENGLWACAGANLTWDELYISADQMRIVVEKLGLPIE